MIQVVVQMNQAASDSITKSITFTVSHEPQHNENARSFFAIFSLHRRFLSITLTVE